MMQTRFNFWAYLPLILACCLLVIISVFFWLARENSFILGYVMIVFLLSLIFYFVFIELRMKAIFITFTDQKIIRKGFLGFGQTSTIPITEVDGYKLCKPPYEAGRLEILYLVTGDSKSIRLSELYHENYRELKHYLQGQFKNLGVEDFSVLK